MYTLVFLLLAACSFLFILILEALSDRDPSPSKISTRDLLPFILYAGSAAAALYTQIVSVLFLASLGLVSLPFMWSAYQYGRQSGLQRPSPYFAQVFDF